MKITSALLRKIIKEEVQKITEMTESTWFDSTFEGIRLEQEPRYVDDPTDLRGPKDVSRRESISAYIKKDGSEITLEDFQHAKQEMNYTSSMPGGYDTSVLGLSKDKKILYLGHDSGRW